MEHLGTFRRNHKLNWGTILWELSLNATSNEIKKLPLKVDEVTTASQNSLCTCPANTRVSPVCSVGKPMSMPLKTLASSVSVKRLSTVPQISNDPVILWQQQLYCCTIVTVVFLQCAYEFLFSGVLTVQNQFGGKGALVMLKIFESSAFLIGP